MVKEKETKLDEVKSEVYKLNLSLRNLGDEKESKYKEKSDLDVRLNDLIERANKLKFNKDKIDKKIIEIKKLREGKNTDVQELIRGLHQAKKKFGDKREEIERRNNIKKDLRGLEFLVQTEVLNFAKEKEYMSKINLLKKELNDLNKKLEQSTEIKDIRESIRKVKQTADEHHNEIQILAEESTKIFNELTKVSKDIGDIKKQHSKIRTALKATKNQISNLNSSLAKNLSYIGSLPRVTGRIVFGSGRVFMGGAKAGAGILQKQTEAVREKFKKRKKLSKDDILLLQKEALEKEKRSKKH